MKRLTPFAFSALTHAYIGLRLLPALAAWPALSWTSGALLVLSAIAIPAGWLLRRDAWRFASALTWASYLAMGLFSTLFVLTLLRDALLVLAAMLIRVAPELFAWPTLVEVSAMVVAIASLAVTLIGVWNARRTAAVVTVDIPIAGLPESLRGFTIAQISDIHVGPTIKGSPELAIRGAPDHALIRVLLAHQPRSAEAAAEAGFHLQLSGHTHGGQFWPWNLFVRMQQPFVAGLDRLRDLWIYTSRGTGYWGPPVRFGAPSEITRVRLVSA